jgi:sugar phosphate isomerase/epimerase
MTDFSYQLYSSRNFPPLTDTLRMVAALGYSQVEGYSGLFADPAAVQELRTAMTANALTMPTAHFGLDLVADSPDRALDIARTLGISTIFVPAVPQERRSNDAAGWVALGQDLATAAAPFWEAGLQFGWHNHAYEFADLGGNDLPLDLILQGDARLALELDLAWVQVGGQDPLHWIAKYADRITAAHIKDIAPKGEALDEDGWADVGHGVMDWPVLMAALRRTGCSHFVMEHDNPNDHQRFARRSIATVQKL